MAVSAATQRGMWSKHADASWYVDFDEEADRLAQSLRSSGEFRRVQKYRFNNGTRERPNYAYKVLGWR